MLRFIRTLYLKWILKDCQHICRFCKHKNTCPIGSKELTERELKMECDRQYYRIWKSKRK